MENTLDQQLHSYLLQLDDTEKKSVLLMLKGFINNRTGNTGFVSAGQYNKEIDEVIAEAEEGNFITHEEMEK